ncbi:hypothetical protein RDWZM_005566, partial [Blomia tropicalis]
NDIDLAKKINIREHLYSLEELALKFQTNLKDGLSSQEAENRLRRDGPNAFTPPKTTSTWIILLKELTLGFASIMWLAIVLSLIVFGITLVPQDYILSIVLFFVVVLTGFYSWSQQRSSGKIFDSFKNMMPQETIVIRDGKRIKISAERLVVGDVVLCKGGERIPADVRIIKCEGMKVDNSSLTGESEPLSRSPDAGHQQPLEAKNIAFFSTSCVDGSGTGVVIATGDNTVMGKIAKLVTNIETRKSPIGIEIHRFVIIVACLAITDGITFFIICLVLKISFFLSFILMIGIVVGNIPEGLLPALTLSLTLTAKRLARKNCLIKYLEAVETLGSTSTICSDKTGTLTENRMTVEHVYLGGKIIQVTHVASEVEEDMKELNQCWNAYQRCAKLCSRATFTEPITNPDIMKRECSGDASETAILRFMESVSPSVAEYREKFPKIAEKPFSSVYKYQYSVHRNKSKEKSDDPNFFMVMKGAPERIIKLCDTILNEFGETVPLIKKNQDDFESAYRELGSLGERVLAFCDLDLHGFEPNHQFDLDQGNDFEIANLRFIGLVALIDPPRATVPYAIEKCKMAGINVIMVTGDHPITAQAIAKSIGLISRSHRRSTIISLPRIDKKFNSGLKNASIVIPGDELAKLSDQEVRRILIDYNEIIFARTSPQQKLRIVENCQLLDRIVAVTGDGVNDSPALKRADIGIAMGITGSDVSKQAADMILMDDNFSSIVVGVEEGRKIFDNLKKTISYIMAGNSSTLYPFVVYLVLGFPLAISPIKILCIAIGTDMVPAISLAHEPPESDIMNLPPRNPKKDFLVTRNLLLWSFLQAGITISCSGYMGYFITMAQYGWMPHQLWQLRALWDRDIEMTDWYGQEWTLLQRNKVLEMAQTAYFVSVVVAQWMDVCVNKTRRVSIFTHGFGNWFLNFSILFETSIACFVVYCPTLNNLLTFQPVSGWAWLTGLPFFCYLLVYEEFRKWIVRTYPNSFYGTELAR